MKSVAFIGLGNMGSGMAANLAKQGYRVMAFDLSNDALDKAEQSGCQRAATAAEAVMQADVVVSMLPAGKHVANVYATDVFPHANPDCLLIDCSTIDVETAKAVESQAESAGLAMVDAPVSGGVAAAAAGTLTFMVGGKAEHFAMAEPVLAAMGKKICHAGEAGTGQAAKICNNMILGASMIATCEAFALAEKLNLDPATFFDIASNASGQTWSMTSYCPVKGVGPSSPADRDFDGGFAAALMLKDLHLALAGAESVGADVPMGKRALEFYQEYVAEGLGGLDFSSVIRQFQ